MAGDEPQDMPKFTGLSKYFNSYTIQGRANFALATYASLAVFFIYMKFKGPKEPKK